LHYALTPKPFSVKTKKGLIRLVTNKVPLFTLVESGPSVKKQPRGAVLAKEPACGVVRMW